LPDILDFTVEEDQPVMYLVIGNRSRPVREIGNLHLTDGIEDLPRLLTLRLKVWNGRVGENFECWITGWRLTVEVL